MQPPPAYEEATYQPPAVPVHANPPVQPPAHQTAVQNAVNFPSHTPVNLPVYVRTSNYHQEAVHNSRYPSAYGPMDAPNGDVPARRRPNNLQTCKKFLQEKFRKNFLFLAARVPKPDLPNGGKKVFFSKNFFCLEARTEL